MSAAAAVYRQAALAESWRLVGLLDRDPFSATRGSLSRTHWGWKFEDFPFPRLQEGVYALARLYALPGADNPFFERPDVSTWIEWSLEYWASRQHADGAFDEAYPFEQCLAATAFTSFYAGHAFLLHRERLSPATQVTVTQTLRRAADWLVANDETHGLLSNHLAAAVAALELVARITGDARYSARARVFLERIFAHQSAEGWLKEYDGADIGYGTHGFFYLAAYWRSTGCAETLATLQRLAGFLSHFVHPDGTLGGEYASRNTEFYYPAGLEIVSPICPASAGIARFLREAIAQRRVCGAWSMDLFNFMPMLNNLLFAMDAVPGEDVAAEPVACERAPFTKYFPECGLWVVNGEGHYAVIGLGKGGTVSLFDKRERRLAARHAGLVASGPARRFTSQDSTLRPPVTWSSHGTTAHFDVPWKKLGRVTFTPPLFVAFRLFNLSFGRLPAISRRLKRFLVHVLISRRERPPIVHRRTVHAEGDVVRIEDELTLPRGLERLEAAAQFTSIHMGSSMYPDRRAVEGSTATTGWRCSGRVRLSATLDLTGVRWTLENA